MSLVSIAEKTYNFSKNEIKGYIPTVVKTYIPQVIKRHIPSRIKNISFLNAGIGTVALAGAGMSLSDIHHEGKEVARENRIEKDADAGYDYFTNTRYLDSKSGNVNHLKKALFESELNNNFRGRVSSATGYVKGAFEGLINKIVPIGLATAALLTKGKASMISAGALVGYGAYKFVTAGFGHMGGKYEGE